MTEWNDRTLGQINEVIDRMVERDEKINFYTVAEKSGYSRVTLYKNPEIKERIMALRKTSWKMIERAEERDWADEARKRWNIAKRGEAAQIKRQRVVMMPDSWKTVRSWYERLRAEGLVGEADEAAYQSIVSQTKK